MKRLMSMFLILTMVFSLTAMGSSALAAEDVEINFWSMWNEGEPQATVIAEAAEAFEQETGIHVNIEWKGRDINTLLTASLDSGDAIDIFEDDYNRIGQVYTEWTYDLTEMAVAAGYEGYDCFNNQAIA